MGGDDADRANENASASLEYVRARAYAALLRVGPRAHARDDRRRENVRECEAKLRARVRDGDCQ